MLAKRIIACLDVMHGRVVKGRNFKGLKYAGEPTALASKYANEGADEIVFLDITASAERRKPNRSWISDVAKELDIPFTVGGGISSLNDVREVLSAGADKVSINTAAVVNPLLIVKTSQVFGSQCITIAIDAKKKCGDWKVFSCGGRVETNKNAIGWAVECAERGAGEILLTSMDADGTRTGYDVALTKAVSKAVSIPVVASGGAGSLNDVYRVLTEGGASAALLAGMLHFNLCSIKDVKRRLKEKGISIR